MSKEFVLTEQDLEALFAGKKTPNRPQYHRILKPIGIFCILFLIVFVVTNYSGLYQNFYFWYETEYQAKPFNTVSPTKKQPSNNKTNSANTATVSEPVRQIDENHIVIDSIKVDAPISWRVINQDNDVRLALQKGVIHISGTALPGEQGNVFITGHSSDLLWSKGSYKTVFALLNKLVVGDEIQVKYQGTTYTYKVTGSKVVSPDETSVMNPTKEPTLTIVTCTPVGTSLRRLVITARQTSPDPTKNSPAKNSDTQQKLPKAR